MNTSSPDESSEIHPSIRRALDGHLVVPWRARRLHGDASTRVYYRLTEADGKTTILAVYDDDEAQRSRFVEAWRVAHSIVPMPEILIEAERFVLQQDVGDRNLSSALLIDPESGTKLYGDAVALIPRIHELPPEAATINPRFDTAKFSAEMEMTITYYVERMCAVSDLGVSQFLRDMFDGLSTSLASHPYRLCHRDFHGDNLYILNDHIFIIDYQDLRLGPDAYDLASLLRDRGTVQCLGHEAERTLLRRYADLISAGDGFESRYWETLLQRSIKILGTFSMQALTRERRHYLDYIPPALTSIRECVEHLPQYRELLSTFPLTLAR